MNEMTTQRMLLMTALLAAVAALLAGPANAVLLDTSGGGGGASAAAAPVEPGTIPYLSHGVGVDESQFAGEPATKLTGVHAALQRDRTEGTPTSAVQPGMIPYPYASQGVGVDESQFSGQSSLGLTGDSPLTRAASEPLGLTGDSALTRRPVQSPIGSGTVSATASDDRDWTWVGFGAGMAVLAAALTGVFFSARHRGRVALP
jgi:hypothetical protein